MNYEQLLEKLAREDERFVVMTAENRALIRNLPSVLGPRFIDTGITEQCMIGAAAGLALRGRIPVVHALAAFLTMRGYEFIRTDVGIGNVPVKLSSFIPGFLSDANGPTHQAIEDISLMRAIPNVEVFAPADEDDLVKCLPKIWLSGRPAYVRINNRKGSYTHEDNFEIGRAEVVAAGHDVTILTYGFLFEQAIRARAELEQAGRSVGLINIRSLKPFDEATVLEAMARSRLTVTLEDHFHTGGLYSIVAELLLARGLTARVLPIDLGAKWFRPALLQAVLEYEGFTGPQIASRISDALA